MKGKQKARKAAVKASCGAVPQSAEDSEVMTSMLEDHLSDYQTTERNITSTYATCASKPPVRG